MTLYWRILASMQAPLNPTRWQLRDTLAAIALFAATAAVTLWQNAHIGLLWDLSYLLDNSYRFALGQVPYRDFPFAHPPIPFLIQAAIIKLFGRVVFYQILYAAFAGALGTVLTWRIMLRTLTPQQGSNIPRTSAWLSAFLLTLPLTALGLYCILPIPYYDGDSTLSVLLAIYLLQRLPAQQTAASPRHTPFALATGFALVVPLFVKQNIGVPFLVAAITGLIALLILGRFTRNSSADPSPRTFALVLLSALATLAAAALLLHLTVGLRVYVHWTVTFAAQRRLPPLANMLGIYLDPIMLWTLPCIAVGLLLLKLTRPQFSQPRQIALRATAVILLAAPFLRTLALFFLHPDTEDRTSDLLSLWPPVLILAAVLVLIRLRRTLRLPLLLAFLVLAAINGTLLSQQLWGSTYAIWPLLLVLIASLLAVLQSERLVTVSLASIIAVTLLLCGSFYLASEERLSYSNVLEGEPHHSVLPELRGLTVRGPSLPAFDHLVAYTNATIPTGDGIILINGEDPFYFVTGRTPQFPVLLFDPATDPYTPAEVLAQARSRKRNLQILTDPTPSRAETLDLLSHDFVLFHQLDNYDIYRHKN